jgi:thiol-disulfide isomerase/thioredoxin
MTRKRLLPALLLCLCSLTSAHELQPFAAGSMAEIEARYENRPFVLALWSLTCPPCLHELELLQAWHSANPAVPLVLVATDGQGEADAVRQKLAEVGLTQMTNVENWNFADTYIEKLRFSIDPRWRGELPRSYLYTSTEHTSGTERHAISGALTTEVLQNWLSHISEAAQSSNP